MPPCFPRKTKWQSTCLCSVLIFSALCLLPLTAPAAQPSATTSADTDAGCGEASLDNLRALASGDLKPRVSATPVSADPQPVETSMKELRDNAGKLGIELTGIKCTIEELQEFGLPAIVQTSGSHFVSIDLVTDKYVRLYERRLMARIVPRVEFEKIFSGYALVPSEAIQAGSKRRLTASTYIEDLGAMPAGSGVTRSFSLTNNSSVSVNVLESVTCCGTKVEYPQGTRIASGAKTEIKVDMRVDGPVFEQTIHFRTDQSPWPVVSISMIAEVVSPVIANPQVLDYGTVERDTTAEKQFVLSNVTADQEQALSFPSLPKFLTLTKKGYDAKSRTLTLAATLDTSGLRGRLRESAIVKLGSDQQSVSIDFPIMASVTGEISVSPDELMLGFIRNGLISTARTTLVRRQKSGFSIKNVIAPAGVAVSWKKKGDGYELQASVGPEISFGILDDFVIVLTDVPDDKEIKIPIYAALEF